MPSDPRQPRLSARLMKGSVSVAAYPEGHRSSRDSGHTMWSPQS